MLSQAMSRIEGTQEKGWLSVSRGYNETTNMMEFSHGDLQGNRNKESLKSGLSMGRNSRISKTRTLFEQIQVK